MKRMQSPTLLRLISIGFLLVALPLGGAIVTAIVQVEDFARDSRQALVSVEENASTSRALATRSAELERTARQYQALSDPAYKTLYDEHRAEIRAMIAQLIDANSNVALLDRLADAKSSEVEAHQLVASIGTDTRAIDLENAFAALRAELVAVYQAHNEDARELANSMPAKASALQRLMISQAGLVIPLSIGLAVLFGVLITRPVRQIDQAIRCLGQGALNEPVQVRGTRDLEELGFRLDWLRLRLLELETQKAQFLRNVSHELKTPLTNIREGAELLLDGPNEAHDEAEIQSITHILRDNSVRLQQMIEDLLRYAAAGDLTADEVSQHVQLDQLVKTALEHSELALAARRIRLEGSLDPCVIEGSPKRLRVIIDNLLSNAIKHTPAGGKVRTSLRSKPGAIELDVQDSGPGVSAQDALHVFEWFYTGPRPPDAKANATGIGLAIAQEYAHQQGGNIQLIASSRGAHFRWTLQKPENNES